MNKVMEWLDVQPFSTQMAIGVPVTILRVWYPRESVGLVKGALRSQGLREAALREGLLTFLRMTEGSRDDEAIPMAIRDFLRDESGLITKTLSSYAHADGQLIDVLPNLDGAVTVDAIDRVLNAFAWSRLWTMREVLEINERVSAYVIALKHHVIDEHVEIYAKNRLEAKAFPGLQRGAEDFLRQIVEVAPETRTLPARAAALTAFLTDPD